MGEWRRVKGGGFAEVESWCGRFLYCLGGLNGGNAVFLSGFSCWAVRNFRLALRMNWENFLPKDPRIAEVD